MRLHRLSAQTEGGTKWLMFIVIAMLLHAGLLTFGGLLFPKAEHGGETTHEVSLDDVEDKEEKKPEEQEKEKVDAADVKEQETPPPMVQQVETNEPEPAGPAGLAALDLDAISGLLSGGGDGGFGGAGGLGSGGVIGGVMGKGGGAGASDEFAGAGELQQPPRMVSNFNPKLPPDLRSKGATATVIFFVGADGTVPKVEVEEASDSRFADAVKEAALRVRFEPGQRDGRKVGAKAKQKIRIPPKAG